MIKTIYNKFRKIELYFSCALLLIIFLLVFVSAIMRSFGNPISWAQDAALVAFGWQIFLAGDYMLRETKLINIDILQARLPKACQKALALVFDALIIAFLLFLVVYGFQLFRDTQSRLISTLGIPYAWVTLAVPCGAALMLISMGQRVVKHMKKPAEQWNEEDN